MDETQYRLYRLRDDLTFYLASRRPEDVDAGRVAEIFQAYQAIWDKLGDRWLEYRRIAERGS